MNINTSPPGARRPRRVFYGWWVLAAASVQGVFGNGAISSGFPRFFEPIRSDLGISYTSMSLVFSLARAEGGMGGPLVGWLVDKFGSRPMILFGGLTAGIGLMLLSRADTYWQLVILYVGVVSLGKTAGLGQTLMATVNQWFVRRKAVAMSTLMTAFAGGGAIVMTSEERARDLKSKPIHVRGYGESQSHWTISAMPDLTETTAILSGAAAMEMAGVTHGEVDVVEVYDSFTVTVLLTIESLGFCRKGEGGPFFEGGRTAPGGDFPLNTNGGGLSYAHPGMYGIFPLIESVRQLRGECGERQVAGAEIALAHGTGGVLSSSVTCILSNP